MAYRPFHALRKLGQGPATRRTFSIGGMEASAPLLLASAMITGLDPRQRMLGGFAKKYPSPHVKKVVYDATGELVYSEAEAFARDHFDSEALWRHMWHVQRRWAKTHEPFKEYLSRLDDPEFRQHQEAAAVRYMEGRVSFPQWLNPDATLISAPFKFGSGEPSVVVFFPEAFAEYPVRKPRLQIPGPLRAEADYVHERFHAQYFAEGMPIGDVHVDSSVVSELSASFAYLDESQAMMDEFEFFNHPGADPLVQLYVNEAMDRVMDRIGSDISLGGRGRFLNNADRELIKLQHQRYAALLPEIEAQRERLRKLLRRGKTRREFLAPWRPSESL